MLFNTCTFAILLLNHCNFRVLLKTINYINLRKSGPLCFSCVSAFARVYVYLECKV